MAPSGPCLVPFFFPPFFRLFRNKWENMRRSGGERRRNGKEWRNFLFLPFPISKYKKKKKGDCFRLEGIVIYTRPSLCACICYLCKDRKGEKEKTMVLQANLPIPNGIALQFSPGGGFREKKLETHRRIPVDTPTRQYISRERKERYVG